MNRYSYNGNVIPTDTALIAALRMLVDDGEAEAIALASEKAWRLVVDDLRARSVARNLGVPIIGTIGVLVRAKQAAIITFLRPLLNDLEASGFHMSNTLKEEDRSGSNKGMHRSAREAGVI